MTTLKLDSPQSHHSTNGARRGITLVQLHNALWRVTRSNGEVMGYLEKSDTSGATRYRARRLVSGRRFIDLGEFWSIDDAVDCYRFA